jgi:hypothetical protein
MGANIKMDLRERKYDDIDTIHLVQNRVKSHALKTVNK